MRLMETIRRRGAAFLTAFLVIFVVSVFAGLGVSSFFGDGGGPVSPRGKTPPPSQSKVQRVVMTDELADVALRVNGHDISSEKYNELLDLVSSSSRQDSTDPGADLNYYSQTAGYLIQESVVMAKGEELGVSVGVEDIRKAKDELAQQYMAKEDKASGNVIGDLAQKFGDAKEKRLAFEKYLETQGISDRQWAKRVKDELYVRKTREKMQEAVDAEKATKAEETKAIVDEKIKEGADFAELAKKYSEDYSAPQGGDLGTWINRGTLLEEVEKVVFATETGKLTDWITVPAGLQKFLVSEKKEAKGPDFEKAKPGIIDAIKVDKGADYKPTDEEIAKQYEGIKGREILLKTSDPGVADQKIGDLVKQAVIEVNDPYVLAAQALLDDKLQPMQGETYEKLVELARTAPVGASYDFSMIKAKLENGKAQAAEVKKDATDAKDAAAADPATPDAAKPAADTPAADAAAPAETKPADAAAAPVAPVVDEELAKTPAYALAIALFTLAVQGESEPAGYFPYYIIGKTYIDWLKDDTQTKAQPVDRQKAREEAEKYLARATERNEYSALTYAYRGLNLAWLDRKDDAKAQLEKAQKYAPREMSLTWDLLKEAYQILDDKAKLSELDTLITKLRQEQLQEMIENAQKQQQQGGQQGMPQGMPPGMPGDAQSIPIPPQ